MNRILVQDLSVSRAGIELITQFEGFVPYPYYDLAPKGRGEYEEWTGGPERHPIKGLVTIGFGHTNLSGLPPKIVAGMRMTRPEALAVLQRMLNERYAPDVRKAINAPLHQHEFDALVSFAYNLGAGALKTIAAAIRAGQHEKVPAIMMRYTKARQNGQLVELRGLVRRRRAEAAMWRGLAGDAPVDTHESRAKAEPPVPPKTPMQSTTNVAAIGGSLSGAVAVGNQVKDAVETASSLSDALIAAGPWIALAIVIAGAAWWIIRERNKRLREDLV